MSTHTKQQRHIEATPSVEFEFDPGRPRGKYVKGRATVPSPSGHGTFMVQVSDWLYNLKGRNAGLRISRLDLEPIPEGVAEPNMDGDDGALQALQDQRKATGTKKPAQPEGGDQLGRIVEIQPADPLEPGKLYRLSFEIDAPAEDEGTRGYVGQGKRDWYIPSGGSVVTASATVKPSSGDADVYLYMAGRVTQTSKMSSLAGGTTPDSVYGTYETGQQRWILEVYGYRNASYSLTGSWIIKADEC